MKSENQDYFNCKKTIETGKGKSFIFKLPELEKQGLGNVSCMPYSIKILLESVLRNCDGYIVTEKAVKDLAQYNAKKPSLKEVPFKPARVLLQDFTGVPAVVDLAAMRSAMNRLGGDAKRIEPLIPCDLIIDHSIQTDKYGTSDALKINMEIEFERNKERYEFLKWGQNAFTKLRIIPPGVGIIHQINLEYLAQGVFVENNVIYPDSLVGTDSHTVMINGLGIVGWGVGGIEAEAVMLGQPLYMLAPQVVGFKLDGELPEGTTATDLTLTIVQMLREKGVVEKIVEFYGPGVQKMSLPDRATIANMAPEYGATMGYFPVDDVSLDYLRSTGRPAELVDLVERYSKEQGLFRSNETFVPDYSDTLELDMSTIEPSLAGPKRPQDRVPLARMKEKFKDSLTAPVIKKGFELGDKDCEKSVTVHMTGQDIKLKNGFIAITSITSCTNTSNPSVMIGAGVLAKNAVKAGLKVPPFVKTSLAPGSRVVTEYLDTTGLSSYLDQLGFNTIGYGCASCIGNSGPLDEKVTKAIEENKLIAASVLSGNRNFEGRVHPLAKANYLASPPLVVAYALAGRVDIDMKNEPIGIGKNGQKVYLKDIWPLQQEVLKLMEKSTKAQTFEKIYSNINAYNPTWNTLKTSTGDIYEWKKESTYIQEPPFFVDLRHEVDIIQSIKNARVLALLGDSVTTDHISPAGSIPKNSPAEQYLFSQGVERKDFNSFGSRRGNDQVMVRGTFGNIRLKNLLAPGTEGGVTIHLPDGEQMPIYDAAQKYNKEGIPLVVFAGKEYGTGSSRDWAAKGTLLLGIKAVIAESFERIHRSNLVGMGVLPLQFNPGVTAQALGLTGHEEYSIDLDNNLVPMQHVTVFASHQGQVVKEFKVQLRLDTPVEIEYYRNGGILHTVLRKLLRS